MTKPGKTPTELSQLSFVQANRIMNLLIDDGITPSEGFLIAAQLVARVIEMCDPEDRDRMLEKHFVGATKAAIKDLVRIREAVEAEEAQQEAKAAAAIH